MFAFTSILRQQQAVGRVQTQVEMATWREWTCLREPPSYSLSNLRGRGGLINRMFCPNKTNVYMTSCTGQIAHKSAPFSTFVEPFILICTVETFLGWLFGSVLSLILNLQNDMQRGFRTFVRMYMHAGLWKLYNIGVCFPDCWTYLQLSVSATLVQSHKLLAASTSVYNARTLYRVWPTRHACTDTHNLVILKNIHTTNSHITKQTESTKSVDILCGDACEWVK